MKKSDLKELYNHAYEETKHYRSFQWQISVWAVTLLIVETTLPKFLSGEEPYSCFVKSLFLLFSAIVILVSIWQVCHCHRALTDNRKLIWRIEKYFGFHDSEKGSSYKSIIPGKFKKKPTKWRGSKHVAFWIFLIFCVGLFNIIQLLQKL